MTPAPARSRTQPIAPRAPRRVSGPANRRIVAVPAGATTIPRRGSTGLFARVRALPEHRMIDRLLRSRLWIWALGILLGGIVTMQVSLLKLNSGISRAVTTTTTLERQNAQLEQDITRLTQTDRIEKGAETLGLYQPSAGAVGYLRAGDGDAVRAVKQMQPPSEEAAALLANNGIVPGSLAAVDATVTAPVTTTETPETAVVPPTATETTATGTTAAPPDATEAVDPAPVGETTPTTTTTTTSGGAAAPQG